MDDTKNEEPGLPGPLGDILTGLQDDILPSVELRLPPMGCDGHQGLEKLVEGHVFGCRLLPYLRLVEKQFDARRVGLEGAVERHVQQPDANPPQLIQNGMVGPLVQQLLQTTQYELDGLLDSRGLLDVGRVHVDPVAQGVGHGSEGVPLAGQHVGEPGNADGVHLG